MIERARRTGEAADRASWPASPPRVAGRGLAHGLVDSIHRAMREGRLKPGDKLPTESAIMQSHGVSRTVVREALSRLQASGLVETRHGIGTFVLQPQAAQGLRLDATEVATTVDVLSVLELRISLETESAWLAAARRSEAQLAQMRQALDAFESNLPIAGDTVSPDFRFHLTIAQATGNPYFAEIMGYLGSSIIPRTRIAAIRTQADSEGYLARVNREHEEIYAAIARRDADAARAAMRLHLTNSRERLRVAQEAARTQAEPKPNAVAKGGRRAASARGAGAGPAGDPGAATTSMGTPAGAGRRRVPRG